MTFKSWIGLSLSLSMLSVATLSAEACCGPNGAPEFFRHQYHAFKRGHVPGYLHRRHRRLLGGIR